MGGGKQQSTSNSQPWSVQQPYLENAFKQAQSAYDNQTKQGAYSGDYVAAPNANQYTAANTQFNTAMGQSTANNAAIGNQAYNLMGTGNAATGGALAGYGNFLAGNNAQGLTDQANAIAKGFDVQGAVDSATRIATRNAAENVLPSLYRGAAAGGNLNSDRTALAEGVVNRGLQENAQGLAASLMNQNYQTGLSAAQGLNSQNLSALGALGSIGQSLGQSGLNALSTNINNSGAIANQAQEGANTVQQLDQSKLTNDIQKFSEQQNFPWQALQNYMGIVGGQNWGGTTNSTTTTNPSGWSIAGGLLGGLGSFWPK